MNTKQLTIRILSIVALLSVFTWNTPPSLASQTKPADFDAYLRSKNSPLAGQGSLLDLYGQRYNVDPRLVIAIAGDETNFGLDNGGLNCPQYKNFWNLLKGGNCYKFSDWDTKRDEAGKVIEYGAIEQITAQLRQYREQRHLNTISDIGDEYCDAGCENWESTVKEFYLAQGGTPETNNLTYTFDLGDNGIDLYQYCKAKWSNADNTNSVEFLYSTNTSAWMCRVAGSNNGIIEYRAVDMNDACEWQFGDLYVQDSPSGHYDPPDIYAHSDNAQDRDSWKCYYRTDGRNSNVQNASGFPEIKSASSKNCADIKDQSTDDGVNLQQWGCWGGLNQKWRKELVHQSTWGGLFQGDYFQIISAKSGKCLDVKDWSKVDNAPVIQWSCHVESHDFRGSNQLWEIKDLGSGNYQIVNTHSKKCLEAGGDGVGIWQSSCDRTKTSQHWNFSITTPSGNTGSVSSQTIRVFLGETYKIPVLISSIAQAKSYKIAMPILTGQPRVTFATSWPGSDVVMSLTTPSGRIIDRNTNAPDVSHGLTPTSELYAILNPEIGTWEVTLFGADVAPEGEDVLFEFTTDAQAPLPQLAYLDGSTLVLNMGSEERRQARIIEADEINEEFTVNQVDSSTFSVTAFGLTQVYAGVTSIKADGDDGNDVITLKSGDVSFTAPAEITGGNGDDQITSGDGADTLSGGAGTDKINGGGDADSSNGDEGDDDLNGDGGNDEVVGGAGADVLHGGDGDDKVLGEDGADKLYGDAGKDTIEGGADNDYLEGNDGADTLRGGDGDDELYGQAGADDMYGNSGQDKMYGGAGEDQMDGGAGTDYLEGNDDSDTMHGGDEDDNLYGNAGADEMDGDAGKDTMYGNTGNDVMHGGTGDDHMEGNEDADTMYGDDGQDMMYGNIGNDMMHGGAGDDYMEGNEDNDTMYGDDGQDTMYGNAGNDAMHGGAGDDYMEGNEDNDTMYGDDGQDDMIGGTPLAGTPDGQDTLYGGADQDVMIGDNGSITRPGGVNMYNGSVKRDVILYDVQVVSGPSISANVSGNDTISGDDGDDLLFGQGSNDTMSGGAGNDYLEGNAGADNMNGDAGQDDLIGGGSANDGVIDADRRGDGLLDMGDEMHGGDAGDVMIGDNSRIIRPVDGSGHWQIDPNTKEPIRQIVIFDVEIVGGPTVNPATSGSDLMFGDAGDDKLFGQGNGSAGDAIGMDPPDGVDNDRNGRENGSLVSLFDCLDGPDNDGDGLIDTADPQCAAAIDNNPGGDEMHGGPGVDYMEGNHGSDWMFGDDGEDDMLGGSSAGDGVIGGPVPPTGLRDGHDIMNGNAEDDVLLGDNGQIVRPSDVNSLNLRLTGGMFDLAIRDTWMTQTPEPAGAYGNDWMSGGDGHDDLYGQLGDDYLEGNYGEDAIVGDLGKIINNLIGANDGIPDPGIEQRIAPNAPFFDPGELIYKNGSLFRQVGLYTFISGGGGAGNDTIYGGNDDDRIHSGPGADIVNGNADEDVIYTGDDSDAVWGGPGHDILFGGYGIDHLDVLPRPARADKKDSFPEDPPTWFEAAKVDNYQGLDIMYGAWDRDWMQADVSAPGRVNGDRMIDWAGGFNAYYRCDAAYGDWVITRQHSPSLVAFLQALAQGHGAVNTSIPGTSGFRETAIVFSQEIKYNANSPNPDNPAHFTCGPAQ